MKPSRRRRAGRTLPWTFGLLVAGALGLAGMPPFGTFLGKALMEDATARAGHSWLPWLFVAASALRGLHSGQVGDSITWLTVGAAGLGALLVLTLR